MKTLKEEVREFFLSKELKEETGKATAEYNMTAYPYDSYVDETRPTTVPKGSEFILLDKMEDFQLIEFNNQILALKINPETGRWE